jgi:4-alpha-glucanotransferase
MKKHVGTMLPFSAIGGRLDKGKEFLAWLSRNGQSLWQFLPLHETHLEPGSKNKHVPSPYKGYGIGLDSKLFPDVAFKKPIGKERESFISENESWLLDYALFCALRDHFGTDDWTKWNDDIRRRDLEAINKWKEKLGNQINKVIDLQCHLHNIFRELHGAANKNHIFFVGDLSFYLPLRSPLVWKHQDLFEIDPAGQFTLVSGSMISSQSHFGRQVWGHPLYRWAEKDKWSKLADLWDLRIRYTSKLCDTIRIDHASGFYNYAARHPKDENKDHIRKGPGIVLLDRVVSSARKWGIGIMAEDSGELSSELRKDIAQYSVPGIRALRFGYSEKRKQFSESNITIDKYPRNAIAYTTTHDTETLMGYLAKLDVDEKKAIAERSNTSFSPDDQIFARSLRHAVIRSPSNMIVIPIQDWLLSHDRINTPGTEKEIGDKNWKFKLSLAIKDLPDVIDDLNS